MLFLSRFSLFILTLNILTWMKSVQISSFLTTFLISIGWGLWFWDPYVLHFEYLFSGSLEILLQFFPPSSQPYSSQFLSLGLDTPANPCPSDSISWVQISPNQFYPISYFLLVLPFELHRHFLPTLFWACLDYFEISELPHSNHKSDWFSSSFRVRKIQTGLAVCFEQRP